MNSTNTKIIIGIVSLIILLIICFASYRLMKTDVKMNIVPDTAFVSNGESLQFTANVTGTTNTAVDWLVNDPSLGEINRSGLFIAKGGEGTIIVSARSREDTNVISTATVTLETNDESAPQVPVATPNKPRTPSKPKPPPKVNNPTPAPKKPVNQPDQPKIAVNDDSPIMPPPVQTTSNQNTNPSPRLPTSCIGGDIKRCEKLGPTTSRDEYSAFEMFCGNGEYIETLSVSNGAGLHGIGGKCMGPGSESKFFGGTHGSMDKTVGWRNGKPPAGGYQKIRAWSGGEWDSVGKITVYDKAGGEMSFASRMDKPERLFDCGQDGVITGIYGTTNTNTNMINTLGIQCGYISDAPPVTKEVPKPPTKETGPNCVGKDIKRCEKLAATKSRDTYTPFDFICANGEYIETISAASTAGLHGIGGQCTGSKDMKFFGGSHGHHDRTVGWRDNKPPPGGYQKIRAWAGSEWDSVGKIIISDKNGGEMSFATRMDQPEKIFDCGYDGVITGLHGSTNKETNMVSTLGVYCGYKK
uniref:BIG2 domain-containing protein n=1 Tax=viral metagenome TaxID=1070528 RepID=A0A6C0C8T5_9ZZZZ